MTPGVWEDGKKKEERKLEEGNGSELPVVSPRWQADNYSSAVPLPNGCGGIGD